MQINTSDKTEQRKFGLVMAGAIIVVGLIRWAIHGFHTLPVFFFGVAVAFAVLGLAAPKALQPIFWAWMKFSVGMNWVMTRVLLTLAYFLLVVPGHVILSAFGKDPLQRKWLPEEPTYWEEPEEQPAEMERYFNQF